MLANVTIKKCNYDLVVNKEPLLNKNKGLWQFKNTQESSW